MHHHKNNRHTLQPGDDLPNLAGREVFLDLETTSCGDEKDSLNPWRDCWIAGIAICVDDSPCYYVPVHHRKDLGQCLDRDRVRRWLVETLNNCKVWVNHNIKYDVHALANDFGIVWNGPLVDTRTHAKLFYSDRFNFGLKQLAKDWLNKDIDAFGDDVKQHIGKSEDYGVCHPRIMGDYATTDVETNRELWRYIQEHTDPSLKFVQELEVEVTSMLVDIEREGMQIDVQQVTAAEYTSLVRMEELLYQIQDLAGAFINPKSNEDCFDYFCNRKGLPVMKYTKKNEETGGGGGPSFDKEALPQYDGMVGVPPGLVDLMLEYRGLSNFTGLFTKNYRSLNVDGVLHSDYNQAVRTGRLSVSNPNSQQLNTKAKSLILPKPGHTIVSHDYSQIEFRLIALYMSDENILRTFDEDPNIDYHQMVADMAGIGRRAAKTLNFQNAFGGGRKKSELALANDKDVVWSVVEEMIKEPGHWEAATPNACRLEIDKRAKLRGQRFYDTYHRTLPQLKRKAKAAELACKRNGYVKTMYGRRRHLPADRAYAAFNAAVQGTAADIMKIQAVKLWRALKGTGASIMALVHDDATQQVPTEIADDPRYVRDVSAILESVKMPDGSEYRVPIRSAWEKSPTSWGDAKNNDGTTPQDDLKKAENLQWLSS